MSHFVHFISPVFDFFLSVFGFVSYIILSALSIALNFVGVAIYFLAEYFASIVFLGVIGVVVIWLVAATDGNIISIGIAGIWAILLCLFVIGGISGVAQTMNIEQQASYKDDLARSERSVSYAYRELSLLARRLGGNPLTCSNSDRRGDFLLCSLATGKDVILEVNCPFVEGIHGCVLTENANAVLQNKGFDVTIGNYNSNSNNNS